MKAGCLLAPLLATLLIITGMNVHAVPKNSKEYIKREGILEPEIILTEQSKENIWPEEDRFEESMTVTWGNLIYYPDIDYGSLVALPYSDIPETDLLGGEENTNTYEIEPY